MKNKTNTAGKTATDSFGVTEKPKRYVTEAALCAKEIRRELKQAFPTTKFSIRSSNFAGGDSVDINWTDGPTSEEVDKITKQHQDGDFDGMQDLYEYRDNPENKPRAKYVMTTRHMSEETQNKIIADHNAKYCEAGQIKSIEGYNEDSQCWNREVIWRAFRKLNLEVKNE